MPAVSVLIQVPPVFLIFAQISWARVEQSIPGSKQGIPKKLRFLFAGYSVTVAVQLGAIAGISSVQRGSASCTCCSAVRVKSARCWSWCWCWSWRFRRCWSWRRFNMLLLLCWLRREYWAWLVDIFFRYMRTTGGACLRARRLGGRLCSFPSRGTCGSCGR